MKLLPKLILGLTLGLATVSWAVTPHEDGSVTYTHEELNAIRMQFHNLQSSVNNCAAVVYHLREENEILKAELRRLDRERL